MFLFTQLSVIAATKPKQEYQKKHQQRVGALAPPVGY